MRIANKPTIAAPRPVPLSAMLCLAFGVFSLSPSAAAYAADAVPAVVAPAPAAPMANAVPDISPIKAAEDKIDGNTIRKDLASIEDKTDQNARDTIKHLDTSPNVATLEDLNIARQAIVRLEAMIDVEKRLAEFEKLRDERAGGHSLAGAIPASALTPSPLPSIPQNVVQGTARFNTGNAANVVYGDNVIYGGGKARRNLDNIDIVRISGADGKYAAVLKINNDIKTVHVGDTIAGEAVVRFMTSSSVLIEDGGQTRNIHIKNVDVVYNATR